MMGPEHISMHTFAADSASRNLTALVLPAMTVSVVVVGGFAFGLRPEGAF